MGPLKNMQDWTIYYVYVNQKEKNDRLNCEVENENVLRERETDLQTGWLYFLKLSNRFDGINFYYYLISTYAFLYDIFCNFKHI